MLSAILSCNSMVEWKAFGKYDSSKVATTTVPTIALEVVTPQPRATVRDGNTLADCYTSGEAE